MSASAVLTLSAVKYFKGTMRKFCIGSAALSLLGSIYLGKVFGGFWPGFYTILGGYMLVCSILPWLDFARRRYLS
jgi:hypothetical protein